MSEKVLMLGNEAIARGAYEAGVKVSAAYPGTPSTEISEYLTKYSGDIYAEWSPNEKVAMEVAIGASVIGVRAMASMKHVGVNVAADPLYSVSYAGVNGGLVLVAADDPGLYSSQNEQDTRAVARAAHIPVIEPSDSMEAKEFMKYAFELSEKYDTPVILRSTTRLSHSQSLVELTDRQDIQDKPYEKDASKTVLMPGAAKKRHLVVEKREIDMAKDAFQMPINRIEYKEKSIGVITSGIPYTYVREALPEASVLKLGLVNPLPREMIEEFAQNVETLYIVEELEPIIEEQVKSWGISCTGKEIFSIQGEYNVNMIKQAILKQEIHAEAADIPARPPILCPGCPHRAVFSILKGLKIKATGDIGCYTLGSVAPLSVIDTCICMGASISMLHGMEKAKGKDYVKSWVAVIGDSTFMHTGVNSLMNMVYNQSTATVIILDNSTTAMTGHQDHAGTGKTLRGDIVQEIDLPTFIKGMGVPNVSVIDAYDLDLLKKTIRTEVAKDELSVIIAKSPCIFVDKTNLQVPSVVIRENCKKCGACLKHGCPALTKNEDGTININETLCTGCSLCYTSCKFDAIRKGGQ